MNSPQKDNKAYHHGDLAETLMELAIQHIAADGTEKLSLRALAREAGVSQSAPYRHFPSKRCLFAALATTGFNMMHDAIDQAAGRERTPEDRFLAIGVAYVEFALAHPTHYHLMFGSVLDDFSDYTMLETASARCYDRVREVMLDIHTARGLSVDKDRFTGAIWAAVHGTASLLLARIDAKRPLQSDAQKSIFAIRQNVEETLQILFDRLIHPN